jgi:hypothetical protein
MKDRGVFDTNIRVQACAFPFNSGVYVSDHFNDLEAVHSCPLRVLPRVLAGAAVSPPTAKSMK